MKIKTSKINLEAALGMLRDIHEATGGPMKNLDKLDVSSRLDRAEASIKLIESYINSIIEDLSNLADNNK